MSVSNTYVGTATQLGGRNDQSGLETAAPGNTAFQASEHVLCHIHSVLWGQWEGNSVRLQVL